MNPVDILGWAAAAVGSVFSLPQLVALLRTRRTDGISLPNWQLLGGAGSSWVLHGFLTGAPNVIVSNLLMGISSLIIVGLVAPARGVGRVRRWLPSLGVFVVCGAIDLAFGPAAFGVAIAIPSALGIVTQLIALIRSADVLGVSPTYLVVNMGVLWAWTVWGVLVGDAAFTISGGANGLVATANLIVYVVRRLRAPRTYSPFITADR